MKIVSARFSLALLLLLCPVQKTYGTPYTLTQQTEELHDTITVPGLPVNHEIRDDNFDDFDMLRTIQQPPVSRWRTFLNKVSAFFIVSYLKMKDFLADIKSRFNKQKNGAEHL